MLKVFINPGHCPGADPGACGFGLEEATVAKGIADLVQGYLSAAGCAAQVYQANDLDEICNAANEAQADIFISIHCNGFNGQAHGTETCVYNLSGSAAKLAQAIQNQIVSSLGTVDRGLKEHPEFQVLNSTNMPAVLVECAFIDNAEDNALLRDKADEFARAIARGVTDYDTTQNTANLSCATPQTSNTVLPAGMVSPHFSVDEVMCHGASQGHCHCGSETAAYVSPRLLELLEQLRENIGGPIEISCAYRCPAHNAAIGGAKLSQHVEGTAADVQTPNYEHCHTPDQLFWYCEQLPFDGYGKYSWGVHVDTRNGGIGSHIVF